MSQKYIRNQTLLAEDLGDNALILDTDGNKVIELNRTGAQLWRILNCATSKAELITELKRLYPEVSSLRLEADTADFLEQALACHAIKKVDVQ